jgi:hypothetical protein
MVTNIDSKYVNAKIAVEKSLCNSVKPSRTMATIKCYQKGQGIFEFIVVLTLLLVPFVLGISYLSRVGDLRHKSLEASRYATWERTVWGDGSNKYNAKSDNEINNQATLRVFGHSRLPINSATDGQAPNLGTLALDPYLRAWDTRFGPRANLMLPMENGALNKLTVKNNSFGLASSVPGFAVVETLFQKYFNFDDESGFYNSAINLSTYKEESWYESWRTLLGSEYKPLIMESRNAMLVGTWNSANPEQVKKRIEKLTIASLPVVKQISTALETVASIPNVKILLPELDDLDIGIIKPDLVACQRTQTSGDPEDPNLSCVVTP